MDWLRQKWVCILFLVLFPPLGIYLLWKYRLEWSKNIRVGATLASVVLCAVLLCAMASPSLKLAEIVLGKEDLTVDINKTAEVEIAIEPNGADFSDAVPWTSDAEIVEVSLKEKSKGVYCCQIRAKQVGEASIMVYCGKIQSDVLKVRVINRQEIESQAFAAEQAIVQIGEVTLQSGEAIVIARQAYDALGEDAAALVGNYDVLLEAEQKLQELQEEAWRQAEEAQSKIDAIGEVGLESEGAIAEAREYYNNLPEAVRPLIQNYQALEQAEQLLEQKKAEQEAQHKPSAPASIEPGPSSQPSDLGKIVYWVPNGEKYHTTKNCRTLARSKDIRSGTVSQAGGRDLCKVCG